MVGKRRRGGSGVSPLEECFGRWRVYSEPVLAVLQAGWPSAVERVRAELQSLEQELNSDRGRVLRLLRESVVAETPLGPVRRYRVSTPAGWFRLLFVIDVENCLIVFTDVQIRDEETYKRVRRRLER